jgi:hypothetical protein
MLDFSLLLAGHLLSLLFYLENENSLSSKISEILPNYTVLNPIRYCLKYLPLFLF